MSFQLHKIHSLISLTMNQFSGLSWNVRGCNNSTNRRNIKTHIKQENINFICLQETKCSNWNANMSNSIWNNNPHDWISSPSVGLSGGLLILWDTSHYKINRHTATTNWLLFKGSTINTNVHFMCINVYGPQETREKTLVWEQLSDILMSNLETPICLMEDFNSV